MGLRAAATILHVDLDAFYAAVEVLVDPGLAGKPVIVGGTGGRGVVASASYEARAYGVHSAMPSARARRLCPHAVFVPGRYSLYGDYSRRLHAIFRSVTPLVEGIALDEAFLDVAGARRMLGEPPEIAARLRRRIGDELGLSASVGVATTKFVAKLASEAAKPTASRTGAMPGPGVKVVDPGTELAFLQPLPVSALWGVGPATRTRLDRFGIATIGDLAALPRETLVGALGQALGTHLHELAWGRDPRPVEPDRAAKSIGHEETYARDHRTRQSLGREAVRLSDAVAARLRASGLAGRTITLKVRFGDFRTITRSRTVREPVATGPEIARLAQGLLAQVDPSPGVRLLGVAASNLVERPGTQLTLPEGEGGERRWEGVGEAVAAVRRRYGEAAVGPAALLDGERSTLRLRRLGDQQWGPAH
ncbi:MAG: DNA polymerase IV [Actinomycetota bacterium]|nr:DNA polymerase IV [Actinomycetota bacterium]